MTAPEAADPTPGEVGLSEAEREMLREAIADGRVADSIAQHGPPKDHALLHRVLRAECARFVEHAAPAVGRIVAARTAARDAEVAYAVHRLSETQAERDEWQDAAEAAEARAAELRATVERVEEAVACPHGPRHYYGIDATCQRCDLPSWVEALLRAALTTPPTTEGGGS